MGISSRGATTVGRISGSVAPRGAARVTPATEIALIDLRGSTWRDTACRIADRRLTRDEWERLLPGREYAPAWA